MVYITNITPNISVGVAGKILKPGDGREFEDVVADVRGVAAAQKKGLISIEMVKDIPEGVRVIPSIILSGEDPGDLAGVDGAHTELVSASPADLDIETDAAADTYRSGKKGRKSK